MEHTEFMDLAIAMLQQSNPKDKYTPKVGAVIAIENRLITAAHRGLEDHAEKIALGKIPEGLNLCDATVYTTLEPCTKHVRRRALDSCTDRLITAHVRKVVIGILDPNQGVCGKGVVQLQQAGIEVELFPHALSMKVSSLMADFIRTQNSIGIEFCEQKEQSKKIIGTYYAIMKKGNHTVSGNLVNPPEIGEVHAIVEHNGKWWPQGEIQVKQVIDGEDKKWRWSREVNFGTTGIHRINIVRANDLGKELLKYYGRIGQVHRDWIKSQEYQWWRDKFLNTDTLPEFKFPWSNYTGIEMNTIPKGLDIEAWVEVYVEDDAKPDENKDS